MKYTLLPLIAQLVIHSSEATKTILGGCTYNEFQCNNGECVSDEYMCSTDTPTTTSNGLNKLVCDGVVYDLYGTIIQQPAGVCEQNTGSMWRCDSFGSLSKVYYEYQNCTGNSISTESFSSFAIAYDITEYSVTCCSGNQCNFGLIRTWDTTKCDDYSTASSFEDEVKLIGGCADKPKTTYSLCLNGKLTEKVYYNAIYWTDECVGDVYDIEHIFDGQCEGNNTMQVICGTAQDTCSEASWETIIILVAGGICICVVLFCICRWYQRIRARIASKITSKTAEFMAPIIGVNVTKSVNDASLLPAANNDPPVVMVQNDGSYY